MSASREPQPRGCLGGILRVFGVRSRTDARHLDDMPYRVRDDFLSAAEMSFYRVLEQAVGSDFAICPKVNLGDVFFVADRASRQSYWNRISRKHVDFLLCDPRSMRPVCGIELDDASHDAPRRQERDAFVDRVFEAAALPLVRVPVTPHFQADAIRHLLEERLASAGAPAEQASSGGDDPPTCPKCGVPMVLRTASRGRHRGEPFYGCSNYPRCSAKRRA